MLLKSRLLHFCMKYKLKVALFKNSDPYKFQYIIPNQNIIFKVHNDLTCLFSKKPILNKLPSTLSKLDESVLKPSQSPSYIESGCKVTYISLQTFSPLAVQQKFEEFIRVLLKSFRTPQIFKSIFYTILFNLM